MLYRYRELIFADSVNPVFLNLNNRTDAEILSGKIQKDHLEGHLHKSG